MPELAEVAYFANRWRPGLDERVREVVIHPKARVFRELERPRAMPEQLARKRFQEIRTHGKQMLFGFEDRWLVGHLGMSGKLWCAPVNHRVEKHDHLVIRLRHRQLVFTDPRMFGSWQLLDEAALDSLWNHLPPEVTDRRFTKARLAAFLQRRARRPLKAVLLMQECFPGIGNWMADEVLWRTQLDPRRLAGSLTEPEVAALWKKLRLVCRQAMRIIGTDWGTPPRTWLFPHRWKDGGCCPCGAPLVREDVGGRTTCWCPTCQES